jgi:hypothetical protein
MGQKSGPILEGKRLDVKEVMRVTVTGTLQVFDHPAL